MSDSFQREWRFYLGDMIEFSEKVLTYTKGLDQAGFVENELTYDATLRNLELIGEAATHIPDEVRNAHPRNPMANDYCNQKSSDSWLSWYR